MTLVWFTDPENAPPSPGSGRFVFRTEVGRMLAILVPSRGRPGNLDRLVAAIDATATGDCLVYAYVDDDDPTLRTYRATFADSGVQLVVGSRVFYAAAVNLLAALAVADGATHLAMFGDDVLPETVGWDRLLIDALGDRLGIAYGSDGLEHLHGPDLPTHYVTQAEVYRRLGWLIVPGLAHLFADNVAREIGRGLGNFVYVPEAKITHNHPWAGLAADDQTYREGGRNKRIRQRDKATFDAWMKNGNAADIAKLLAP